MGAVRLSDDANSKLDEGIEQRGGDLGLGGEVRERGGGRDAELSAIIREYASIIWALAAALVVRGRHHERASARVAGAAARRARRDRAGSCSSTGPANVDCC